MNNFIYAALTGATITALPYAKTDKWKSLRVFLTGFSLAVFIGEDCVNLVQHYFNFKVSEGAVFFLVSFLGAEVLERALVLIRLTNVNSIWNKK